MLAEVIVWTLETQVMVTMVTEAGASHLVATATGPRMTRLDL